MSLTYSTMMELGAKAPDFRLPATDGKTWRLADLAGGKGLLVVFTCNHCPYAQGVEDRLIQIGRDYLPQGLRMVLINSNDAETYPDDSFANMKIRAQAKDYPFPYCYDETQTIARAYHAACTPDCFLFDGELRLVYRGRIDDNWKEPEQVTRHDLRDAIDAVLAGQRPAAEQLASMGCNIKWRN